MQRPARRPFFEALEERTLLSGGLLAAPLSPLSAAPLQAPVTPATPVTSAPAVSTSWLGILDNPVVRDVQEVTGGLNVKVRADVTVPRVAEVRLATDLTTTGNRGLPAHATLDAGITALGSSVLRTQTGAAVGVGSGKGVSLNLDTSTTLAAGSLPTLNGNVGASLGGQGVTVATVITGEVGGEGGLSAGTGGTVMLNNGGASLGGGGGVILGNPAAGNGGSGGAGGGGGIVTPGNSGGSGGAVQQGGGGTLVQVPPALAGTAGSSTAAPATPISAAGGTPAAPLTVAASPAAGSQALLAGVSSDPVANDFLSATPADVQGATAGQVLDGTAVDTLFQSPLLVGGGDDTDRSDVLVPVAPAAVEEAGMAPAEPVVGEPELFDGAQPLLPQGDDLAQGCVPFDVKALDDSLRDLLQQFEALSGDFAGLLARLERTPWFVAMAVLAVTCEVYRRKLHQARGRLALADVSLTWFPTLTGSGSSEERYDPS
jgi:hypothetical protein